MTYPEWAAMYPQAAAAMMSVIGPGMSPPNSEGKSEAWAQQQVRLKAAKAGAMSWRNNVFATPAKCPDCQAPRQPIRAGLCNDSTALNQRIKSSDLILAIPRVITPAMVGATIAQFGSIEMKKPGWTYKGNEHEAAQAAWLTLVNNCGGAAAFSTGEYDL